MAGVSILAYLQANDFPPYLQSWGMGAAALLLLPGLAARRLPVSWILFLSVSALAAVAGETGGAGREPLFRLLSVGAIAVSVAPLLGGPGQAPRAFFWGWISLVAILYLRVCLEEGAGIHGFPFGNTNLAGGFFVGPLVFGVSLLLARGRATDFSRWLAVLGVVAAAMALAVSDSQSAWLPAGGGILLVVLRRLSVRRRLALLCACVACAVVAGLWAWSTIPDHPLRTRQEYLRYESSAGARLLIWEGATRAFLAAPVLGHGPGSFPFVFPSFRSTDHFASGSIGLWEPNAHNLFLDLLVETGLLGCAAFLWVCLRALRAGFASGSDVRRASAVAAVAILANGLVSVAPSGPQGQLLLWIFLAVADGWGTEGKDRRQESGVRRLVMAGIALVWMKIAVCDRGEWLLAAARGHLAVREGQAAVAAARFGEAVSLMEKAGEGSPLLPNTLLALANARAAGGDPVGAIAACRQARPFAEAFPVFDLLEGRVRGSLGDRDGAARAYAAYARVRLFDRVLFADDLWANAGRDRPPAFYWSPFLEPLARAARIRRWDLEVVSMRGILLAEAGRAEDASSARREADAVYGAAEHLQGASGIVAYARLWYPVDPAKAEAILSRWEAARGPDATVTMFLDRIRKSGR